ncbi:hypothetical protein PRIPAC_70473 [Pristionchus pacificus]|uniref:LRAT domain-containing protein n=1 Tax=Pristionchus pacificus TaxID=54126 RepID=A0A2A6C5U5_PRIPA|nr:hypothetical protein PRIPAC_70473 [Pristionchus pacificus]|eukprot:PDM73519.1 hypothetical protein PRIPAC_40875 [Pristionchus pacificus]
MAPVNHTSSYMHWSDLAKILEQGDLVEFGRGNSSGSGGSIYQHWAIYVGLVNGVHIVIHYSNDDPSAEARKLLGNLVEVLGTAQVQLETLERVANGCRCRKNNGRDRRDTPYAPDEIVAMAQSMIGEKKYHIITNNCEHFAHFCRYGRKRSGQVTRAATTLGVVAGGLGVVAITGTFAVLKIVSGQRQNN